LKLETFGSFIGRTPALPLEVALSVGDRSSVAPSAYDDRVVIAREWLRGMLSDPFVKESLWIASPDLVKAQVEWERDPDSKRGRRFEMSAFRYVTRMSSRCVPFGLFAGVFRGRVENAPTSVILASHDETLRLTKLDMGVMNRLRDAIVDSPDAADGLTWVRNPMMWFTGDRGFVLRRGKMGRVSDLTSFRAGEEVMSAFAACRGGARLSEIASAIADADDYGDAIAFVRQLASEQMLVPTLGPSTISEDPLEAMLRELGAANAVPEAAALPGLLASIDAADGWRHADPLGKYADARRIIAGIIGDDASGPGACAFLVNHARRTKESVLNESLVTKDLSAAFGAIAAMGMACGYAGMRQLNDFAESFTRRYGRAEVPLLIALDPENGIGFGANHSMAASGMSELADGYLGAIAAPAPAGDAKSEAMANVDRFQAKLVRRSMESGWAPVSIGAEDVRDELGPVDGMEVARVMSVNLIVTVDGYVLDGFRANSGSDLLSRFCHVDPEIRSLALDLADDAKLDIGDAVHAQVAVMAPIRAGNVVLCPRLHDLVIDAGGADRAYGENIIGLEDILVSVRDGVVCLRSARLGKWVIPHSEHVLDYKISTLSIYAQFLLCLCFTGGRVGGREFAPRWVWGPMAIESGRLPRITCGNIILSPAIWYIRGHMADCESYRDAMKRVSDLRLRHGIPELFQVVDPDTEESFLVDSRNPFACMSFIQSAKGRKEVKITEFLRPAPGVVDECGRPQSLEVTIPILTGAPARPPRGRHDAVIIGHPERHRAPGSEWVYLRIVAPPAAIDSMVTGPIADFARAAMSEGFVDRWHYVRYADPDHHLRLRFRLAGNGTSGWSDIVNGVSAACDIGRALRLGEVHDFTVNTYIRELERYPVDGGLMDLAESIFCIDSMSAIEAAGKVPAHLRWRCACVAFSVYARSFGMGDGRMADLAGSAWNGWKNLIGTDSEHRIGRLYRQFGKEVAEFIRDDGQSDSIYGEYGRGLASSMGSLDLSPWQALGDDGQRAEFLLDCIHMAMNRIFVSDPNRQEACVYGLIERVVRSAGLRDLAATKKRNQVAP
jgi:thiopeptide-type bacteriocin biosynthesis protein